MIRTTGDFCFLFCRFKGVNFRSCDRRIDRCFLTFHRNKVYKPLHTWVTMVRRGGNLLLAVPLMSYYRQTKHGASITGRYFTYNSMPARIYTRGLLKLTPGSFRHSFIILIFYFGIRGLRLILNGSQIKCTLK